MRAKEESGQQPELNWGNSSEDRLRIWLEREGSESQCTFEELQFIGRATKGIIGLFGPFPAEEGFVKYVQTYSTAISEACSIDGQNISREKIERAVEVLGSYIDEHDCPELTRNSLMQRVLFDAAEALSLEEFLKRGGKHIRGAIASYKFLIGFKEAPLIGRYRGGDAIPEDHMQILEDIDTGFDSVEEEDPIDRIKYAISLMPEEHGAIISLLLEHGEKALVGFSEKAIREAKELFAIKYGLQPMSSDSQQVEKQQTYSIGKTLQLLRTFLKDQNITSLGSFFGLLSNAGLTNEEIVAMLYHIGWYHSEENLRIFAINENTRIDAVNKGFYTAVLRLLEQQTSFQNSLSTEEICLFLQKATRQTTASGTDGRIFVPKDIQGRVSMIQLVIEGKSEEEIAARIRNEGQRQVLAALKILWNDEGKGITLDGIYRLVKKDFGYSHAHWQVSQDVLRILHNLLEPGLMNVNGRRIPADSSQAYLISHELTDRERRLLNFLPLRGRREAGIYESVYQYVITPNDLGMYREINSSVRPEIFRDGKGRGLHGRIIEQLVVICGGEIRESILDEARTLALRVIGMRLGLAPEEYTSAEHGWKQVIKNELELRLKATGGNISALAKQLQCEPSVLLRLISVSSRLTLEEMREASDESRANKLRRPGVENSLSYLSRKYGVDIVTIIRKIRRYTLSHPGVRPFQRKRLEMPEITGPTAHIVDDSLVKYLDEYFADVVRIPEAEESNYMNAKEMAKKMGVTLEFILGLLEKRFGTEYKRLAILGQKNGTIITRYYPRTIYDAIQSEKPLIFLKGDQSVINISELSKLLGIGITAATNRVRKVYGRSYRKVGIWGKREDNPSSGIFFPREEILQKISELPI